jgi:hypothetical protein
MMAGINAGMLGEFVGEIGVVEFQKRGLPHLHVVMFLTEPIRQWRQPQRAVVFRRRLERLCTSLPHQLPPAAAGAAASPPPVKPEAASARMLFDWNAQLFQWTD